MKKNKLLNSSVSSVVSKMGHTDMLVIADCGLPIPDKVERIDLALTFGKPSFLETLEIVLEELEVEEVIIAKEIRFSSQKSIDLYNKILEKFSNKIIEVSHEEFKKITEKSKAIIRTGEIIPYANIILKSGVVF